MLIGRQNIARQWKWALFFVLATSAAIAWYWAAAQDSPRLPGGSSLPGFSFGVASGLIMLFEFLLWPRRRFRKVRIGSAELWLRAHLWLGGLSIPLTLMHSGFQAGGRLCISMWNVYGLVIGSGVFGLAMQQFLPRWMLEQVPAETIHEQIDHVSQQLKKSAARIVAVTSGPDPSAKPGETSQDEASGRQEIVTLGTRSTSSIQGKVLQTRPISFVPKTETLWRELRQTIEPYLELGAKSGSSLSRQHSARQWFASLAGHLPAAAGVSVEALADLCEQRRQLDWQAWMHLWLHSWLWIHVPLSSALLILLGMHIFVAWRYW